MNGLKLNLHSFLGLLIYVSIKNLDKVPIFSYLFKGYSFEQIIRIKPMMKLAIIFLPVLFAVIWAAFVGLRINKVEIRDGKRKLINY